jgi:LytTr DNA-binding domain
MIAANPSVTDGVTSGGATGAGEKASVTKGGQSVVSGAWPFGWRHPAWLTAATLTGFGAVQMIVNATSLIDERQALGRPVAAWQPWVWEATSLAAWLVLLPVILWVTERISRLVATLAGRASLHLIATVIVSLAHSAAMWGLRSLSYQLLGAQYRVPGPLREVLLYEYRKDAITYAMIVLAYLLFKRLVAGPVAPLSGAAEDLRIEVRDGNRAFWIRAAEIEWVSAAGNYVELHGAFGTQLVRKTLADILAELGEHDFVQVHRSRLVQRSLVAKTETRQSGDFDISLRSGAVVGGSRRYRSNL